MFKKKFVYATGTIFLLIIFSLVLLHDEKDPVIVDKSNAVTVAVVNFHSLWGNKEANLRKIKSNIVEAARRGTDIVIFPELALTGYDVSDDQDMHRLNAETIPGPSTYEILELTQRYNLYVVLGMSEKKGVNSETYYNSAAVVGPEQIIGSYAKLMPYQSELVWCEKGEQPFYFITPWGPVGIGICYDTYMFPELPRFYAALGARLYINITAISPIAGWKDYYLNQLNARAIENMMYVASANLTGKDLETNFLGTSLIVGPGKKKHIVKYYGGLATQDKEEIIVATIDLANVDRMRKQYPLFREGKDMSAPEWRLDLYMNMLQTLKKETSLGQ